MSKFERWLDLRESAPRSGWGDTFRRKDEGVLLGLAAGAGAAALWGALRYIKGRARSKNEYAVMAEWWRTLQRLIDEYGADSERVAAHMEQAEHPPLDSLKSMAEKHIEGSR